MCGCICTEKKESVYHPPCIDINFISSIASYGLERCMSIITTLFSTIVRECTVANIVD